jgi:NAD(P)H-hydrate repair Nnr-like enzyme with NAD(P)H-hydrate dehydratase domain
MNGDMLQGCEAIAACYPGVLEAEGPGDVLAGNIGGLIKALGAVGRACNVFAVPHCCNNPGCSNVAGAGELVLVTCKSCICCGCQVAGYCGRVCQKAHWKQHKPVCKMLQASRAGWCVSVTVLLLS